MGLLSSAACCEHSKLRVHVCTCAVPRFRASLSPALLASLPFCVMLDVGKWCSSTSSQSRLFEALRPVSAGLLAHPLTSFTWASQLHAPDV